MFKNPEAISLAPNCSGISMFEKVPDNPPVNKKKTIIVPCIVTSPKYMFSFIMPSGAQLSPKKTFKKVDSSPGQAS